jgi:hypothetical protein
MDPDETACPAGRRTSTDDRGHARSCYRSDAVAAMEMILLACTGTYRMFAPTQPCPTGMLGARGMWRRRAERTHLGATPPPDPREPAHLPARFAPICASGRTRGRALRSVGSGPRVARERWHTTVYDDSRRSMATIPHVEKHWTSRLIGVAFQNVLCCGSVKCPAARNPGG